MGNRSAGLETGYDTLNDVVPADEERCTLGNLTVWPNGALWVRTAQAAHLLTRRQITCHVDVTMSECSTVKLPQPPNVLSPSLIVPS